MDEFVADISSKELADIPGLQDIREKFAHKAIAQYAEFIKRNPNDPDVQIGYAKAKGTLGTILGDIGSFDQAVKETKEGIRLLEADVKVYPNNLHYSLELAKQRNGLAILYWKVQRGQEATPFVEQAIKDLEAILTEHEKDSEVIYSLAIAYNTSGNIKRDSNFDKGKKDFERSINLALQIVDTYVDKSAALARISDAKHNLSLFYKDEKSYQKSLELLDESDRYEYAAMEKSSNSHSPSLMGNHAISLGNRAILLGLMNKPNEALKAYEEAVKINREVVIANPKVTRFSYSLADNIKGYAGLLSSVGEYDASRKAYEEATSILEDITQRADDRPHYGVALVEVLDSLASFHSGSKGNIPRDEKVWHAALERMLNTARQLAKKYPDNEKVNFELAQSLARMANFEAEITKNDEASMKYYKEALKTYSEKVYTGLESTTSNEVANFLGFAESTILTASRLNKLDEVKQINELAYKIGKNHTTMAGIQSLGTTFGVYSSMLQKAEQYPQAIEASKKQLELTEPVWKKAEWNWWLRSEVGGAYYHLAQLYQKINNQPEEIHARLGWLQVWGSPMHSIDSYAYLNIDPSSVKPDDLEKLRAAASENAGGGMKRFTVPTDFKGIKQPFYVYITNVRWPNDPLGGQDIWVEKERGGKIPMEVIESFRRLHKIAHENNVSFVDLCVYAMAAPTEEDKKKTGKLAKTTGTTSPQSEKQPDTKTSDTATEEGNTGEPKK